MHRADASKSRATSYVQWSEYVVIKTLTSAFLLISTSALFIACSDGTDCSDRSRIYAGSIEISGHKGSKVLEDLECIQVVTGNLKISDQEVKSLEALSSLEQVQGNLEITESNELSSLKGLERLAYVGENLNLSGLKRLKTFDGLGSLETIGGDLTVIANDNLTSVQGLPSLSKIGGEFALNTNPQLTSAALNEEYVHVPEVGSVSIILNESLKVLKGFGKPLQGDEPCQYYTGNDGIDIFGNSHLEEIELPAARNICISITDNTSLSTISTRDIFAGYNVTVSLSDSPKLKKVDLPYWSFYSLTLLDTGLETLDTFGGNSVTCNLEVYSNPFINDISALDQGFGLVAGNFTFSGNPVLATCQIQAVANKLPVTEQQCLQSNGLTQGPRVVEIKGNNDTATCE
jgi:Receptor L domain